MHAAVTLEVNQAVPNCRALQLAPSAYRRHAVRQRNLGLLSVRAQRDALVD